MMQAAFLNKPLEIEIKNITIPQPKVGEVRIKIRKIGICGSDVHLFQGHRPLNYPSIIGHEGLGEIDAIGEGVEGRELGERVVIEPNIPCQKCKYCLSGRGNICISKRIVGVNEVGCYAEYICLPQAFAWKVPKEVSDDEAVTIEPTAVAYHAIVASKAKPGDTVAVIGLGAIGLLLTHIALSLGYKVFVTEINKDKIKKVEKQGAIPTSLEGSLAEKTEMLSKIWFDNEVTTVFECAGANGTSTMAAAAAPRGAEIVIVGLSNHIAEFVPFKTTREGITIVPSMIYDHPFDFKRILQLLASKTIQPSFIISREEPLSNLQKALEMAAKGKESKIVINC